MSKITDVVEQPRLRNNSLAEYTRQVVAQSRLRDNSLAEYARQVIEQPRLRNNSLAEYTRQVVEHSRLHNNSLAEYARQAVEHSRLRNNSLVEYARQTVEQSRLRNNSLAEYARQAVEQSRLHNNSLAEYARQAAERLRLNIDQQMVSWKKIDQIFGVPSPNASLLQRAHETWTSGMHAVLKRTTEAGIWKNNPSLGLQISSLPIAYTSFCRSTGRNLRITQDAHVTKALEGSLVLAEHHLLKSIELISPLLTGEIEPAPTSPSRATRLYQMQQSELVAAPEIQAVQNLDELVGISESATSAADVLKMLELIPQVNRSAKLLGGEDIFKPTTGMLEVFTDLFGLVPTNKIEFGKFIDCLYCLFYEAAGTDKLRYLSKNGGPLTETDCDLIWAIKTFRNKWHRHNPDHGSETAVRKSYRSLAEALKRFGFGQIPCNANQYRRFHRTLVRELIVFLEQLRDKLS